MPQPEFGTITTWHLTARSGTAAWEGGMGRGGRALARFHARAGRFRGRRAGPAGRHHDSAGRPAARIRVFESGRGRCAIRVGRAPRPYLFRHRQRPTWPPRLLRGRRASSSTAAWTFGSDAHALRRRRRRRRRRCCCRHRRRCRHRSREHWLGCSAAAAAGCVRLRLRTAAATAAAAATAVGGGRWGEVAAAAGGDSSDDGAQPQ